MAEIFNKQRMERCMRIAGAIMENAAKSKQFAYTVRATASVDGLTLSDLRTHYFTVGVGNDLTDLPFTDMLVVFSIIEQQWAKLKERKERQGVKDETFTIQSTITTDWPDEQAVRMLSQIRIETPLDKEKLLRIVAVREPLPPEGDPQT